MITLTTEEAGKAFAKTIDRVVVDHDRVVLEDEGKPVAAIISIEDLQLLERLEDRVLVEMVRERDAEPDAKERIKFEDILRESRGK